MRDADAGLVLDPFLPERFVIATVAVEFELNLGKLFFVWHVEDPKAGIAFVDGHEGIGSARHFS